METRIIYKCPECGAKIKINKAVSGQIADCKPPLGIKPRYVVDDERKQDIINAMQRCIDASWQIPGEWIEEYNEIVSR